MRISKVHRDNYALLKSLNIISNKVLPLLITSNMKDSMSLVAQEIQFLDGYMIEGTKGLSLVNYHRNNTFHTTCSPEMKMLVNCDKQWVLAKAFQQDNPPIYLSIPRSDHPITNGMEKELNHVLNQWLKELIAEGHGHHWK